MRRLPIAFLTMCLLSVGFGELSASGQAAPATTTGAVGIAPAYDGGGEEWGPLFVQQLTLSLFDEVQARTAVPGVLLNPGGVYTPLDSSWLVDYASDRPELKYLLVTTLKPVIAPEHGKWTIVVDASLLERAGGKELSNWTVTTEIKGRNTDIFASYVESNPFKAAFTTGRRTFDKSPLGHAAKMLAESIADGLKTRLELGTAVASAAGGSGSGRSCPMKVRITYTYKHAASQSYSLLVNGLEESIAAEGGVSSFSAPEAPLLVQFSVGDAPYKLAKQPIYQLSTMHFCSNGTFIVDLGKSGDAHERWE